MKKIISILLVISLLVITSTCFAESKLAEYEEKLKGTWLTYDKLGKSRVDPEIAGFTYPSTGNGSIQSNLKGIAESNCEIYLVETGNGSIWLIINADVSVYASEIAFSADGNILYALSVSGEISGIYKRQ